MVRPTPPCRSGPVGRRPALRVDLLVGTRAAPARTRVRTCRYGCASGHLFHDGRAVLSIHCALRGFRPVVCGGTNARPSTGAAPTAWIYHATTAGSRGCHSYRETCPVEVPPAVRIY